MDIKLEIPKQDKIDVHLAQKLLFINNALENGWDVKKKNEKYIFSKLHEGKKEIYEDSYLCHFLRTNINIPIP